MSTDARDSRSSPPPVREGERLRSGRMRALPITAGDQGDPPGVDDTENPSVSDDAGFTLALSASGPRTTPTRLAVVVEGTPLKQDNRFAGGSYSSLEDEDDSPPLLDIPAVPDQFATAASPTTMAAASDPDTVEAVLGAITESEQRRNRAFVSHMAALGGRPSQLVQLLSDVRGDISCLSSESSALVELNKSTRLLWRISTGARKWSLTLWPTSFVRLRPLTTNIVRRWRRQRSVIVRLWPHTGPLLSRVSRILQGYMPKPWMICIPRLKAVSTR